MESRRDSLALAALATTVCLVYWQLIVEGRVLLTFDALVYFVPLIALRDAALLSGAIPLWNPDHFLGAPFLANPQTGVLYPPNLLTLGLMPPRVYAWQAFGHTLLMALGTFLVARRVLGLGALASFASAVVFALGGHALSLIGHLNQLQAAAWLPMALWLADRARSPGWSLPTAGLALVLALQFLAGHAQQSYITGIGLGLWLTGRAIADAWILDPGNLIRRARRLARYLAPLIVAFALAGLIVAPQLLATLEATSQGMRAGGMEYRDVVAFSLPPWILPRALLPLYLPADQPSSEWVGYLSVTGAILASVAVVGGRPRAPILILSAIVAIAFLLALGQFGPLYPIFAARVPGLSLFRVPARWLVLASFAGALLVGVGLHATRSGVRLRRLGIAGAAAFAVTVVAALVYGRLVPARPIAWPAAPISGLWIAIAATTGVGFAVARRMTNAPTAAMVVSHPFSIAPVAAIVALLATELVVASGGLDTARAGDIGAFVDERPTASVIARLDASLPRSRLLSVTDNRFDPGDVSALREKARTQLPGEWVDDRVAAEKYKDTLTPNLSLIYGLPSIDGYDGGVLPLRSYNGVKSLFPLTGRNIVDGRLGIQLDRVPPIELLSRFGVGWIVGDRHRDLWSNGVYYDLSTRRALAAGSSVERVFADDEGAATDLGIIVAPRKVAGPQTVVADITIEGWHGEARRYSVSGSDLARVPTTRTGNPDVSSPALVSFGGIRLTARRLAIVARVPLEVIGATLIDRERGAETPIPLSPELDIVSLGDVKIYRNNAALPRAFLARSASAAATDEEALAVATSDRAPDDIAVVGLPSEWVGAARGTGESRVVAYERELVAVDTNADDRRVLVLLDAAYPGWRATLDGAPVEILSATGGVRAVAVPPGAHSIVFRYSPTWLLPGFILSSLGLILTALLVVRGMRHS
ncbi:MAG: hypothetical protein EPO26_00225 [Chloroflexota bacterium]|nr:MAG: hypothetical protein EPO26_00225 [Chloroflexota bacterium]